jgi:hypothetical protein
MCDLVHSRAIRTEYRTYQGNIPTTLAVAPHCDAPEELDQPKSAKEPDMKTIIALALVTLFASSAVAQKPVKEPFVNEPIVFDAGAVCAFPVHFFGDGKQNVIRFPAGAT